MGDSSGNSTQATSCRVTLQQDYCAAKTGGKSLAQQGAWTQTPCLVPGETAQQRQRLHLSSPTTCTLLLPQGLRSPGAS